MPQYGAVRFVWITRDAVHLDHIPTSQTLEKAAILVGIPARFLYRHCRHALMLSPQRVIDSRVEAILG